MGGARARRLCPHAAVVPPRFSAYLEASRALFAVFDDASPVVEGLSIDEAFLDVRGLEHIRGTPVEIAAPAPARRTATGRATGHGRCRADEVPRQGGERCREAGRPARRAAGSRAGIPASAPGRAALGRRPGDRSQAARVRDRHGRRGRRAHRRDAGRAARPRRGRSPPRPRPQSRPAPGEGGRRRGSIGAQRALGLRPKPQAEIDAALLGLVDRVTRRLRAAERIGRTVVLRLRFDDFSRATRSHTLPLATAETQTSSEPRGDLLAAARPDDRASRAHARRRRGHEPRERPPASARAAARRVAAARRSTRRSTRFASASAPGR